MNGTLYPVIAKINRRLDRIYDETQKAEKETEKFLAKIKTDQEYREMLKQLAFMEANAAHYNETNYIVKLYKKIDAQWKAKKEGEKQ